MPISGKRWALGLALIAVVGAPVAAAAEDQRSQGAQRQQARSQSGSQGVNALIEDFVLVELAEKAWVGGDFKVSARDGRVTLGGTVPSEKAKTRMGRIVRDTLGVTEVRNDLRVTPSAATAVTPVADDELARRVARQIAAALPGAKTGEDWWFEGWRVEGPDNTWNFVVEAEEGRVYLEGDVPRLAIVRKAIDAARQTAGVRSVRSDLELDERYGRYPYGRPYGYPYAYHPWGYTRDYDVYDVETAPASATRRGASISGRVTAIDRQNGRVTLQTDRGTTQLSLPPAALGDLQQGEQVTLQLRVQESSPAASPQSGGSPETTSDSKKASDSK